MLDAGLKGMLGELGWKVQQPPALVLNSIKVSGKVEVPKGLKAKNCELVGNGCKAIHDHVTEHCTEKNFPLILGGDHCIAIGTISAIKKARKDAGIVWVRLLLREFCCLSYPNRC
jgi:arginase